MPWLPVHAPDNGQQDNKHPQGCKPSRTNNLQGLLYMLPHTAASQGSCCNTSSSATHQTDPRPTHPGTPPKTHNPPHDPHSLSHTPCSARHTFLRSHDTNGMQRDPQKTKDAAPAAGPPDELACNLPHTSRNLPRLRNLPRPRKPSKAAAPLCAKSAHAARALHDTNKAMVTEPLSGNVHSSSAMHELNHTWHEGIYAPVSATAQTALEVTLCSHGLQAKHLTRRKYTRWCSAILVEWFHTQSHTY